MLSVQKGGICISSAVAPVLCDIFLAAVGKRIESNMQDPRVVKICRFVDDFLVILKDVQSSEFQDVVHNIIQVFTSNGSGLNFTWETPEDHKLQFLDLKLLFRNDHICWQYSPRSQKGLLPSSSAHSTLVKRGIAMNCLHSALKKTCVHLLNESFDTQVARLEEAGYPSALITAVSEALLRRIKCPSTKASQGKRKQPIHVIPYIHKLSHNIKKIASRHDVQIVFSAPCKLSKICTMTRKDELPQCTTQHRNRFTECVANVVYEIPLSCGRRYIGQTGRCFNERAKEHNLNVRNKSGGF